MTYNPYKKKLEKFKKKFNLKSRSYRSYLENDQSGSSNYFLDKHYKHKESQQDIKFSYLI